MFSGGPPEGTDERPTRRWRVGPATGGAPQELELSPDSTAWETIAELYGELGEADLRSVVVAEHMAK